MLTYPDSSVPMWRQRLYLAIAASPLLVMVFFVKAFVVDDWWFGRKFEQLAPGMTEEQVVGVLGQPRDRSEHFYLGQRRGFEDAYVRAEASVATHFLVWKPGLDEWFTAGFGEDGELVIAERGGT